MFSRIGFAIISFFLVLYLLFGPEPTAEETALFNEADGVTPEARQRREDIKDHVENARELLDLSDGTDRTQNLRWLWLNRAGYIDNLITSDEVFFDVTRYDTTTYSYHTAKQVAYAYALHEYPNIFNDTLVVVVSGDYGEKDVFIEYRGEDLR